MILYVKLEQVQNFNRVLFIIKKNKKYNYRHFKCYFVLCSFLFTVFPSKKLLPNEIKNDLNLKDYDFIFLTPDKKFNIR